MSENPAAAALPYPHGIGDKVAYTLPGMPDVPLTGRITYVLADGPWLTYPGGEIKVSWADIRGRTAPHTCGITESGKLTRGCPRCDELLAKHFPGLRPPPDPVAAEIPVPEWLASQPVWAGTGDPKVVHLDEAQHADEADRWRAAGFADVHPFAGHPVGERCPVCSDPARWAR